MNSLEKLIHYFKQFVYEFHFYGHPYDCFPTGSMYVYIIYNIYVCVTYASMRCIRS